MFVTHFVHFALLWFICWSEFCHGEKKQKAKVKLKGMFSVAAHLLNNYFFWVLPSVFCMDSRASEAVFCTSR